MAISSPLLEDVSIEGATGILINITGGPDITPARGQRGVEPDPAGGPRGRQHHLRLVIDPDMSDMVKVTVIATGFEPVVAAEEPARIALRQSRVTVPMAQVAPRTARTSSPGFRPEPREMTSRPSRRISAVPQQTLMPETRSARAFGAAALDDEAVLDIPAYLRRSSAQE